MPPLTPVEPGIDAPPSGVVPTTVTFTRPAEGWWESFAGGVAFRAVPLLRVLGTTVGVAELVVVGQVWVTVRDGELVADAFVTGMWRAAGGDWEPMADGENETREVRERLERSLFPTPADAAVHVLADPQSAVARFGKAIAEESRGAASRLRDLRYGVESSLAAQLRPGDRETVLPTLATLLELGLICGRAADEAREAVREGLWVWITDAEAYHSYRATQDPTILNGHTPAEHATRPWMRVHDAAMRQCRAMEEQLAAETGVIAGLLDAAATVASARESESQQLFNTLVGVAAVGLGLPALVLSLYGADRLVPLSSLRQAVALLPIAVAASVAGLVAVRGLPAGRTRKHIVRTVLVVIALMLLLVFAGVVAPGVGT